jgi:hypothetical protein
VAELRGEEFHSYLPPSVSEPLYCQLPNGEFKSWVVTATSDVEADAEDLAQAVETAGFSFMRRCTSLPRGVDLGHVLPISTSVARQQHPQLRT